MNLWRDNPSQMVRDLFRIEPDPWQIDVLNAFPHHPRIAMKASKGPGKTTMLAWLAWNFLLTRPNPKCAATSVSADNLADNLWTELALWRAKSKLLTDLFEWTKTRITLRESPETWWLSARTWSRTADASRQSDTLAGLHADYMLFLIDEVGDIPDAVMASAEAALATIGGEKHLVMAGNPTRLSGPLYRAFTSERRLWFLVEISGDPDDPRRAPRVSITWAREQIEKYGADNPWVLVNVFGRFPPSSINSLIGPDELEAATKRTYRESEIEPFARIIGADIAREGDDSSVIFQRQGLLALEPRQYRSLDGTQGAGIVGGIVDRWDADAVFVDDTGGYGASWIDNLIRLGYSPIGIAFSSKANDPRYYNKRSEMAWECVEWIKRGGSIPNVPELLAAMAATTYTFKSDRLLLEPKDVLKARLGYSPDHFDALGLTFAQPVSRKAAGPLARRTFESDYNPLAAAWNVGKNEQSDRFRGWVPGMPSGLRRG